MLGSVGFFFHGYRKHCQRENLMKLGITIRNWGPTATPDFLTESAQLADRSTLDAIWINDHLGFPPIMDENLPIPPGMGEILDPLGFANFLAACTSRISFGTAVLVLPYRPEIVTQKLITGGRSGLPSRRICRAWGTGDSAR
jgi:alkanesulfonate monooxygenase SsuD/methylene tetrahydromethanopterin reductase-like flavin-dependent oxidoreductase (luciferase family)